MGQKRKYSTKYEKMRVKRKKKGSFLLKYQINNQNYKLIC